MNQVNPWLATAKPVDVDALVHVEPEPAPQLEVPWSGPVIVRGAHGGAGVTTVAQLLPGAIETHLPMTPGERLILVCRSHVSGLLAAQRVLAHLAQQREPAVQVMGLVVNADAPGRAPRALGDLARLVGGGAPHVWHLPWVESWRLTPVVTETPRPVARVVRDITTALPELVRAR